MSEYGGNANAGSMGGRDRMYPPEPPGASMPHPVRHHDLHPWMSVIAAEFELWREGRGYDRPYYRNYSWCAAFAGWALRQSGYTHLPPNHESVSSWRNWGMKLQHPQYGCICVLNDGVLNDAKQPGNPWYHITFFSHFVEGGGVFTGGNQSDRVKPSKYFWNSGKSTPLYDQCEWRWPIGHHA